MLEISNIETYYDHIHALKGVSLKVEEGSIVAMLGANGAGKSTTLKTVMGLIDDQPDKGEIRWDGKRIDRWKTDRIVRAGIGYVPEGREVFSELTVDENLKMGAYTVGAQRAREQTEKMRELFPILAQRRSQLAGTLSGGEQQMLALARAMIAKPRLLMLDEPSLGLSPRLVTEIFQQIVEIRKGGVTILLVEQNARKALEIADVGVVLEGGRIVLSGTAEELKADEDVAEFYLGKKAEAQVRDTQRYKRKKRWN